MSVAIHHPHLPLTPAADSPARRPSTEDDFTLLRRFIAFSDPQAFADIVQRYANFVYATCLRIIGDGARAEDLSQETFFRLMRRPHEVRQNLGGWLHRTATHLALDSLRSESARRRREIIYSLECDHEASTWAELSPAVDQALAEMPEGPRLLLVQHFLLGKTQAQLAAEAGQSPSTISRRMQSALDDLRDHLRLKGLCAFPGALAGLLTHAMIHQAPASLLMELGKITMLSGAGPLNFTFPSFKPPLSARLRTFLLSGGFSTSLSLAVLAMILMGILLRLAGVLQTPSSLAPSHPIEAPHAQIK
jgi:RNA polymerase sigma-70 factor (ECF subfamily)